LTYDIHPCVNCTYNLFYSVQTTYTMDFVKKLNILHFEVRLLVCLIPKLPFSCRQWNKTISTSLGWYISTYVGMDEERQTWCNIMMTICKIPYSLNLWVALHDLETYFPSFRPLSYMIIGCVPIPYGSFKEEILFWFDSWRF